MDTFKISVITASYNQGQYIERTINSVLAQNYSHFEHIIIDGGSNDNTLEILKKYTHLKWISEKDYGQSDALNKGLCFAKGDIIAWINSDDTYCKNAFHTINAYFQRFPESYVVFGNFNVIDENDNFITFRKCKKTSLSDMLKRGASTVGQPALFFKRKILDKVGLIDVSLSLAMDYDFFIRMIKHYEFHYLNETLANFRKHNVSKTITSMNKNITICYQISKKHGGSRYIALYINVIVKKLYYLFPQFSLKLNNLRYLITRNFVMKMNKLYG